MNLDKNRPAISMIAAVDDSWNIDNKNKWELVSSEEIPADIDNEFPSKFMVFDRISG